MQTSRRSPVVPMAGLMVAQSTHAILLGGMALFLPLISADLGLSLAEAGALAAVAAFTYAAAQIPAGLLTETIGARRAFTIGLVGTNLAAIAFTLTTNVALAVAVQFLSGLFRALLFTPGMLLATALFDERRSATAAGLFVVGGVGSNLLLNLIGPVLIDHLSWQLVIAAMAAPGVLLAAYLARFPVDPRPASSLNLRAFATLARSPGIRIVWAIQFIRLFAFLGLGFWFPTYMADRGHSLDLAGLAAALLALSTVPANIVGGYLSDRLDRPAAVIATCLTASAISTALLSMAHSALLLLVLVATVGLSVQAYFGPLFTIPRRFVPDASQALTTSTGNTWANVGGFVAVWMLGLVRHESGSLEAGLLLIAGLLAIGAVLAWMLGRLPADPSV